MSSRKVAVFDRQSEQLSTGVIEGGRRWLVDRVSTIFFVKGIDANGLIHNLKGEVIGLIGKDVEIQERWGETD